MPGEIRIAGLVRRRSPVATSAVAWLRAQRFVRRECRQPTVFGQTVVHAAIVQQAAMVENGHPPADGLHGRRRVRHEDDGLAAGLERLQGRHALPLEVGVADREDLVEQEHVGVHGRRDCEPKPHRHA